MEEEKLIARYRVGEEVWYFSRNQIHSDQIEACIFVKDRFKYSLVTYQQVDYYKLYNEDLFHEDSLFKSKQALKDYINKL